MAKTFNSASVTIRKNLHVRGTVQGVGFRPFVFRLAQQLRLSGHVSNGPEGVTIELEGEASGIERFVDALQASAPALAKIDSIATEELQPKGKIGFEIRDSYADAGKFALVPPDTATCAACQRDLFDPANRRFGYAFTNCTDCGPRYSIVRDIPYDRPLTTMQSFRMCMECQTEYDNPSDRRFHAQPNACSKCGPWLMLDQEDGGSPETGKIRDDARVFLEARGLLRAGKIIAIKGLGGFHIACDATQDAAVRLLRERKRRVEKPFAIMARDLVQVERVAEPTAEERALLLSPRRPIVILKRKPDCALSPAIAPGNDTVGVMLPYTPLHFLLFGESLGADPEFTALVMTSGNLSEEPIASENQDALQRLRPLVDRFVLHNRDIHMRVDDSVVRSFRGREIVLRRGRAYVPSPIDLGMPVDDLLACGGELKNTFCLTKDHYAILSQHIGDMENYETLQFFERTLADLKKFFRARPRAVVHDLHPGYLTTRFAQEQKDVDIIAVQHHHAHIASCMAENHIRDKLIGVVLDGTGYGTDGQIWGGEFLVADLAGFERRAHFLYVPLPGGDAAVRQPWRSALSWLRATFGERAAALDLPLCRYIPTNRRIVVERMMQARLNTVQTSSCGRLFDAVAAILGMRFETSYEGQAAIELEMQADRGVDGTLPFDITDGEPFQIDFRGCIKSLVAQLNSGTPISELAGRFHNTLASVIIEGCMRVRQSENLRRVCLSGGCFQNMLLLDRTVIGLERNGFEVFVHSQVPPNDGGLSLGQAVIANELRNGRVATCV